MPPLNVRDLRVEQGREAPVRRGIWAVLASAGRPAFEDQQGCPCPLRLPKPSKKAGVVQAPRYPSSILRSYSPGAA